MPTPYLIEGTTPPYSRPHVHARDPIVLNRANPWEENDYFIIDTYRKIDLK